MLSLLLAVAGVALLGFSPMWQAWSLQFVRHAFEPLAAQSAALPDPPAGHARAALWQASDALHLRGDPALAETLIASQAAQGDPLAMRLMSDALAAQGDFAGALAIWQKAGDARCLRGHMLQDTV